MKNFFIQVMVVFMLGISTILLVGKVLNNDDKDLDDKGDSLEIDLIYENNFTSFNNSDTFVDDITASVDYNLYYITIILESYVGGAFTGSYIDYEIYVNISGYDFDIDDVFYLNILIEDSKIVLIADYFGGFDLSVKIWGVK